MRPIGYSDKIFYYNSSGNALTYDFQMRITLTAAPNKDALQRAARKTLAAFPEFAVRPVIHDGKIFYEENFSDVAIFDEHKPHALGSDETNGYLLCLICGAREIILSFYHGLSDFVGNWSFICTLIYNYAREPTIILRWTLPNATTPTANSPTKIPRQRGFINRAELFACRKNFFRRTSTACKTTKSKSASPT